MPERWTADLIGEMHLARITARELAAEAGLNPKYLSTVLNGHCTPRNAEKTLRDALERIKERRGER